MTSKLPKPATAIPSADRLIEPEAAAALILKTMTEAPFAVSSGVAQSDLDYLVSAADGIGIALDFIGRRAACLGLTEVRRQLQRGADCLLDLPLAAEGPRSVEGVLAQRLAQQPTTIRRALAQVSAFRNPFDAADASTTVGVARETTERLAALDLLRRTPGGLYRCPHFLRRGIKRLEAEVAEQAEETLTCWGRGLREAAYWVGTESATERLEQHLPTFLVLAGEASEPASQIIVNAMISWGSVCRQHPSLELFVRRGSDLLARLTTTDAAEISGALAGPPRLGGLGELALTLAEAARQARAPGVVRASLDFARTTDMGQWRVDITEARFIFGQGHLPRAAALSGAAQEVAKASGDPVGAASAALLGGWIERERGHLEQARRLSEAARVEFEAVGGALNAIEARLNLALIELSDGQPERSLELLAGQIPRSRLGSALSFRCLSHELLGDYPLAQTAIQDALASPSGPFFKGIWSSYLGRILVALGELKDADDALEVAAASFERAEAVASLTTVRCIQGLAKACGGDTAAAEVLLGEAAALCDPAWQSRHRIVVLAAAVQQALAQASPQVGEDGRELVATLHVNYQRLRPAEASSESVHVRAMYRFGEQLFRRAIDRAAGHATIQLDGESRTCRLLGVEASLATRPTLWRMLRTLAANPEGPTDDALIAATWLGERISEEASRNRLRVAIAELRKRCGSALVVRLGGRYRLGSTPEIKRQV